MAAVIWLGRWAGCGSESAGHLELPVLRAALEVLDGDGVPLAVLELGEEGDRVVRRDQDQGGPGTQLTDRAEDRERPSTINEQKNGGPTGGGDLGLALGGDLLGEPKTQTVRLGACLPVWFRRGCTTGLRFSE